VPTYAVVPLTFALKLKIGTPATLALEIVRANFKFLRYFGFQVRSSYVANGRGDEQNLTNKRKTRNAVNWNCRGTTTSENGISAPIR